MGERINNDASAKMKKWLVIAGLSIPFAIGVLLFITIVSMKFETWQIERSTKLFVDRYKSASIHTISLADIFQQMELPKSRYACVVSPYAEVNLSQIGAAGLTINSDIKSEIEMNSLDENVFTIFSIDDHKHATGKEVPLHTVNFIIPPEMKTGAGYWCGCADNEVKIKHLSPDQLEIELVTNKSTCG